MDDQNFDLHIGLNDNLLNVQVLNSPAGKTTEPNIVPLPFAIEEWRELGSQIPRAIAREMVMLSDKSLDAEELEEKIKEYGLKLFKAVFSEEVGKLFRKSLEDNDLRLQLQLDNTELYELPWEYLYDPEDRRFLSHSRKTSLVRYFKSKSTKPLEVTLPLQVLVVVSNAQDLKVENEWDTLQKATEKLQRNNLLKLNRLESTTLKDINDKLNIDGGYHILHFIGHGDFDKAKQEGFLLLEDESQDDHRVSTHDLSNILSDNKTLKLVFLNACKGAVASSTDAFTGVAQNLVLSGIPSVIAMQFSITDDSAIALAEGFYKSLARKISIDGALSNARKAILATSKKSKLEWGTPVLFTSSPSNQLFDIKESINDPYKGIIDKLVEGSLVPVLGLDVNSLLRDPFIEWQPEQDLPSYEELSLHLAKTKEIINHDNLAKVAQEFVILEQEGDLNKLLYRLYNEEYPPTQLHKLYTSLPKLLSNSPYALSKYY